MEIVVTHRGLARRSASELVVLDLPYRDVGELLAATGSLEAARRAGVRERMPLEAELAAPLPAPPAVWGVGLNYRAKALVNGRALPDDPILFLLPSSVVAAPGAVLDIPAGDEVDYEGEIALLVGRAAWQVDHRDAWRYVAGVTAANDLTARDVMRRTRNPLLAKGAPRSLPLGPGVLDLPAIEDLDRIAVRTSVDGCEVQAGATDDLVFPVPDLLARLTRYVALQPGDVVLTGSPAGTGQDRDRLPAGGEVVEVTVADALPLRNTIAVRRTAASSV